MADIFGTELFHTMLFMPLTYSQFLGTSSVCLNARKNVAVGDTRKSINEVLLEILVD